jgi:hypothetical protein
VTHAGCRHPHQDLAAPGRLEQHGLDRDRTARLAQHGGAHLDRARRVGGEGEFGGWRRLSRLCRQR